MKDNIKNLYRGNIFPTEKCGMSNNEIKRLSRLLNNCFEELKAILPENNLPLLQHLEELSTDLSIQYYEEFFTEGFKLGFRLAAEAFLD
ncbi:MAG: hypothetical protein E7596_03150 [Ruminococcaceae bacterium]|nr:hypothetical protein [Oscillospiraceae bacterium]